MNASFFEVGRTYLIRTVTMAIAGTIQGINEQELLLRDAAWIADTGRFGPALLSGKFDEVELFPTDVIVGRGSIIDASPLTTFHRVASYPSPGGKGLMDAYAVITTQEAGRSDHDGR